MLLRRLASYPGRSFLVAQLYVCRPRIATCASHLRVVLTIRSAYRYGLNPLSGCPLSTNLFPEAPHRLTAGRQERET